MYEWTVMPMGIRNAPATHQRRMEDALRGLHGRICYAYLDDVIIWAQDLAEYLERLRQVLDTLSRAKLVLSEKKTQLFATEIEFLGH